MKLKETFITVCIILLSFIFSNSYALSGSDPEEIAVASEKGIFAGAQATTNGLGFNLSYMAGKKLTLKTGIESINMNYRFMFDENDISYDANFNYRTGGVFFTADYYYTNSLYLSGGVVFNNFNPKFNGVADSDMKYGDIIISASKVGTFKMNLEPKIRVSPYAGIGFRKFIGKRKLVSYNFETGLYYIGPPKVNIEATGLLSPTADPAHGKKEYLENHFSVYKYYPVVKFAIALKLF